MARSFKTFQKRDTRKYAKENARMSAQAHAYELKRNIADVISNIKGFNERKIAASVALCLYYSEKALQTFRRFQVYNEFWTNRTNSAYNAVFSGLISAENEIGFLLAHKIEYGVYLELANDRKHEALWPIIRDLDSEFEIELRRIWADD